MRKDNKKTNKIIPVAGVIAGIAGLSIAYAALSTTLNINGTANVDPANWDIHFDTLVTSAQDATLKTKLAELTTAPTISDNTLTVSGYNITLVAPGDSEAFTVNITNAGDLPALLTGYTKTTPTFTSTTGVSNDETIVQNNITYTYTYANDVCLGDAASSSQATCTAAKTVWKNAGDPVQANDTLAAGQSVKTKVYLAYNDDATELPTAKVELTNMSITMQYTQNN